MDFTKQYQLQKKNNAAAAAVGGWSGGTKKYNKDKQESEAEKQKRNEDYKVALFNRAKTGAGSSKVVVAKLWEAKVEDLVFKPDGTTGGMVVKRRDLVDGVMAEVDEVYQFPIMLSTMTSKLAGCGAKFDEKDEKEKGKKAEGRSVYDQFKRTCLLVLGLPLLKEFVDADPECVEQQRKGMAYWKARTDAIMKEIMTNPSLYTSVKVYAQTEAKKMEGIWRGNPNVNVTPQMVEDLRKKYVSDKIKLGWRVEEVEIKNEEGVVTERPFYYQIHQSSNGFRPNAGTNPPQEVLDATAVNTEMATLIKSAYSAGYQLTGFKVVGPTDEPIVRSVFEPPWANESYIIPVIKISWYNKEGNYGCSHHFSKVCVLKEPDRDGGGFNIDLNGTRYIPEKPRSAHEKAVLRLLKKNVAEADGVAADDITAALVTSNVMVQPDLFTALATLVNDHKIKFGKDETFFKLVVPTLDIDRIPDLPKAKPAAAPDDDDQDAPFADDHPAAAATPAAPRAATPAPAKTKPAAATPAAPAKRVAETVLVGKAKKAVRPVTDDDDDDQ